MNRISGEDLAFVIVIVAAIIGVTVTSVARNIAETRKTRHLAQVAKSSPEAMAALIAASHRKPADVDSNIIIGATADDVR